MPWGRWAGKKEIRILRRRCRARFLGELPEIVARLDGGDRVIYTDCDVIFAGEVVPELSKNPCRYFAVAPEGCRMITSI